MAFNQAVGAQTAQYTQAMSLAARVKQATEGNLLITGHSLGGGLASAAALATDTRGITFNSAGLHQGTLPTGVDINNAQNLITAYHVSGEILTVVQTLTPLPNAVGMPVTLAPAIYNGALALHGIDQVLHSMGLLPSK